MPKKSVVVAAFSVGADQFTTFVLSLKIYPTGRMEHYGMVRMPYSNRPKRGGGKAVPYTAMNQNRRKIYA